MKNYQKIKNFKKIIDYFGSVPNLSKQLGITPSSIYEWTTVPEKRAYQIERLTSGKISARSICPSVIRMPSKP